MKLEFANRSNNDNDTNKTQNFAFSTKGDLLYYTYELTIVEQERFLGILETGLLLWSAVKGRLDSN